MVTAEALAKNGFFFDQCGTIISYATMVCCRYIVAVWACVMVFVGMDSSTLAAQPVVKDRKKATRIRPRAGAFDRYDSVQKSLTIKPTQKPHKWTPYIGAHSRFVTVPGGVMNLFFENYQPLFHAAAGVSIEFGDPRNKLISIEIDWTGLNLADGNWRGKAKPAADAKFAEVDLHMLSVDVSYRDVIRLEGKLDFFYGAGLGLAGLIGKADTTDVIPTCQEPVSLCQHWRVVTKGPVLPTRIIPVVHVTTGLQLAISEKVFARIQLGFRNVFYAGLSAAFKL